MITPARVPSLLLVLALLTSLFATAPDAWADKKDGRITFEVSTEPADLGPGDAGTLVVKGILFDKLHIYGPGDDQALEWVAMTAAGVTYDLDKATLPETHAYQGEFDDEPRPVWEKSFTLRVPITLAKDIAAGTKVGVAFSYYGCTERGCYPQIKNHEAFLLWGADGTGDAAAGADGGGGKPANPRPDVAADTPQVSAPVSEQEGGAQVRLDEAKGEIVVTFAPSFGWHFYGPDDNSGEQVSVEPVPSEGVTFGEVTLPPAGKITSLMPYEVKVPFTREDSAKAIEIKVSWAGCSEEGSCNQPRHETFRITWPGASAPDPVPAAKTDAPKQGEVLFEVIEDETLEAADEGGTSPWQFLLIFVAGLGLAFTPCVLPIIPITVSVISGGNPDIPRQRLAKLLGIYVLGLCLTFATMGVIAAQTGGAMSALFAMPGVQWGIVVLFVVLGFGMYGVYEMQAPSWMMNLQGGAHKRQGSVLGAFLFGCLGAIIASPCTGPAIAFLLIETAREGNAVLGFTKFFTLGLGMGAVLFAAGSLNFMMRPGPWMTWVRYIFGVLIVGVAFYYLSQYSLVDGTLFWILAAVVCTLAALGIAWHLHTKEGEDKAPARMRGIQVAAITAAAIGIVAWYTHVPDNLLSWTYAKDPQHLQQLVADANENGQPVVVDFWGDWCTNCKVYDKRIATTPSLRKRFEQVKRVKVDLSDEADQVRWPMRNALGVEASGAPVMVFIDRKGRIRRAADLLGLEDEEIVIKHIDLVLKDTQPTKTSQK